MKRTIALLAVCLALIFAGSVLAEEDYINIKPDGQWYHGEMTEENPRALFQFKLDKIELVSITLVTPNDTYANVYYRGWSVRAADFYENAIDSAARITRTTSVYLNPGEYTVSVWHQQPQAVTGPVDIKIDALTTEHIDEIEPNDQIFEACRFEVGREFNAINVDSYDKDYFVTEINEAGLYNLEMQGNMNSADVIVYDQYQLPIANANVELGTVYDTRPVSSLALNLEEGLCYIYVTSLGTGTAYAKNDYSIKLTRSDECQKISIPANMTVTSRINTKMNVEYSPAGCVRPSLKWKSSNYSVVTISNAGYVWGHKPGMATLTATSEDGKFTAKCKVKVMDNAFYRAKPLVGKEKALYASVKRLSFDKSKNSLKAEIYLVNLTGQALYNGGDFYVEAAQTSSEGSILPIYRHTFGETEKITIPKGARRVVSTYFSSYTALPFDALDLRKGECVAVAGGYLTGKRTGARYAVKNLTKEAVK